MVLDWLWRRPFWLLVGKVLVLLLLAVSPRTLIGPSSLLSREQESRRPKTPKNILRAESVKVARISRSAKGPGPGPAPAESLLARVDKAASGSVPAPAIRIRALGELTQPDYLKLFEGSPPRSPASPPG